MSKVETSYIIPSKNEPFLQKTVLDLLENSTGKFEVIVHLDGYTLPEKDKVQDDRVIYIHTGGEGIGMRNGIDKCAAVANGDFLIKIDAHCSISTGMNSILRHACPKNGIMIPERRRLDVITWTEQIQPKSKPHVSVEAITYPDNDSDWGGKGLNGRICNERIFEMQDVGIFDIPASQGSCWGIWKEDFERMGGMDSNTHGTFWCESQTLMASIVLRLGGTYQVCKWGIDPTDTEPRNDKKPCFYQHWHKGHQKEVTADFGNGLEARKIGGRGYTLRESELAKGRNSVMRLYYGKKMYPDQKYPLSYLVELHPWMPGWTPERLASLKQRELENDWKV